jgi:hypothetical protein
VYITADCDRAFLHHGERIVKPQRKGYVPLAVRWTLPEVPRGPVARCLSEGAISADFLRQAVSHTFSHSLCTSLSASCLQLIRLSIQPSSVGIVVGSDVGADDSCMGSGILTSSMLVSMAAGRRNRCRWGGRSVVVMQSGRGVLGSCPSNSANDVQQTRLEAVGGSDLQFGRRRGQRIRRA